MSRKNIPLSHKTKLGLYGFSKTQSYLRFAMCKEALSGSRFLIKFKHIYQNGVEPEHYSCNEINNETFDYIYFYLNSLGWGSVFFNYDRTICPEGSFYPFIRYSGKRAKSAVDFGCIWIGSRKTYPRIFVDNGYCKWYKPIRVDGTIRTTPFLPLAEIDDHLNKLLYKKTLQALARE